ncbi:centrosomal protein of 89 kDa-like isoform X1 [Schistocerca americana]|uniref:centrosomal protein of 89 kDa-like isoform X1 n=1 Tax=Schistocerca americana TaxID=7009 RepID=UPI001F502AF8|nr:centrosomal protein of 89 kDa-like isoform X1 [Schistocerca americana]
MPPPIIYTTVPNLPLFLNDTSSYVVEIFKTKLNLDEYSSMPQSLAEDEVPKQSKRKTKRRCSSANQTHEDRRNSSREDSPVRDVSPGCNRHRHQKQKLHRVMVHATAEGPLSPTAGSKRTHADEKQYEALVKEVQRLTTENQQLAQKAAATDSGHQLYEEAFRRKNEQIASLQARLSRYEKHKQDLERQRDSLREQLEDTRQKMEQSVFESTQAKESEDISMLQELVVRLNAELERYQQKFHKLGVEIPSQRQDTPHPPRDVSPETWAKVSHGLLGPLLKAYSETIQEKDDLARSYEKDLAQLNAHCRDLVSENEQLYAELDETTRKMNTAAAEAKILQQDTALVQEQNELLTGQLDVLKQKLQEIHTTYQQKVASLTHDLEEVCQKYHSCRGDLLTLRGQHSVLREEYDRLKSDLDGRVPFSVHSASVSECRRLFEDLRARYETDRQLLNSRVRELQQQIGHMEGQITQGQAEKARLQTQVTTAEASIREIETQLAEAQAELVTTQAARDAARRQLNKAMKFAEELVAEQESLMRQLQRKQQETRSMAEIGSTIVSRMGSLKDKLESVQKGAWQELDHVEQRIRQQQEGVTQMKQDYQRELMRLRTLLQQKETIISQLQFEKSKAEESLELIWQKGNTDNSPKDSLKHVNFLPDTDDAFHNSNS